MEKRSFFESFKIALVGMRFVINTQRNMRIHILIGILVVLLGLFFRLSYLEMAILSLTIMFVIACEVFNTAIELSLDFLNGKGHHPSVKLIKDIAAGGVLLASINAVIVGSIIFLRHI